MKVDESLLNGSESEGVCNIRMSAGHTRSKDFEKPVCEARACCLDATCNGLCGAASNILGQHSSDANCVVTGFFYTCNHIQNFDEG